MLTEETVYERRGIEEDWKLEEGQSFNRIGITVDRMKEGEES